MSAAVSPAWTASRVLSGPGALARLVRELQGALASPIPNPEAGALVLLAVEEAAVNILEHGYGGREGMPIFVAVCSGRGGRLRVVLRDRAPVVDVSGIPAGNLGELARLRASRGRGLALIRLLATGMQHRRRRGGGNELVLAFDLVTLRRVVREQVLARA